MIPDNVPRASRPLRANARARWQRKRFVLRMQGAQVTAAWFLALIALDAAREQLDRYAHATDEPAWQAIDAADLLDAARAALAKASTHE